MTDLERLEVSLSEIKKTLATLIAWIVQSANSPINRSEAMQLLRMLEGEDK